MSRSLAVKIHADDDLFVALDDLAAGQTVSVNGSQVTIAEKVPAKHQFAARNLDAGQFVRMYGVVVGRTTEPIAAGRGITTTNLHHAAAEYKSRQVGPPAWQPPDVSRWATATFDGYHRDDGRVGTANHWLVVPLVFCQNRNIEVLRESLVKSLGYDRAGPYQNLVHRLAERRRAGAPRDELLDLPFDPSADPPNERLFPNIDGIKFLAHDLGCGGTREDSRNLCGLLAGYIAHSNVAGATILSLGCQNAEVRVLLDELQQRAPDLKKPLLVFEQQKSKSEHDMLARAIKQTFVHLSEANDITRQPAPLSKLTIGVECGGSDGFSGISANPVIGQAADYLVACGASVILSEFPELCGVEQQIVDRCVDRETADRFVNIMADYAKRAEAVGAAFEFNPSPGNIRDGLITDAIKSAGAAKKGGTSPIVDAIDYPGMVGKTGLNLLCTPGNDVESTTAMAGAGANLILFSTGLGTPTGNPVAPVVKISSNTTTATRLADIIDFDAGPIIAGDRSVSELGGDLFDVMIDVASGRTMPKAVAGGHDNFQPWKRGVSL